MTPALTAVAVSGGADSLYALASLRASMRERGRVIALHARMLPPELAPAGYDAMLERLGSVCKTLGVPLHIANCIDIFASLVINPFVQAYAQGLTPNPCAHCNTVIKFGLLLDIAKTLGADKIATGHYIRLEHTTSGTALYAGKDHTKDQSYFLALVPLARLANASTPLEAVTKEEVRTYLRDRSLEVPSPVESQEICFVPGDDYRAFLTARAPRAMVTLPGPGPVCLPDGTIVARHNGLWQYTEGQRKGLGIAWKEPLYVLAKDAEKNTLVVGGARSLQEKRNTVRTTEVNYLVPFAEWPQTVLIRTRFRQSPRPAKAHLEGKVLVLEGENSSEPYACGQVAAVYAHESQNGCEHLRVLGGGVISGK